LAAKPDLTAPFLTAFIGPDALPEEVFSTPVMESMVGSNIQDPALAW